MRISDWSSDVCSSDLPGARRALFAVRDPARATRPADDAMVRTRRRRLGRAARTGAPGSVPTPESRRRSAAGGAFRYRAWPGCDALSRGLHAATDFRYVRAGEAARRIAGARREGNGEEPNG